MPEEKKETASSEAPTKVEGKPSKASKATEREAIIAKHIAMRPTGRRGVAKARRPMPHPEATALEIKAHPRCSRRGIKLWGVHFQSDDAITLEIAKLPPGIASKICRHPELVVVELKGKERLTPERARPRPPKRKPRGSERLGGANRAANVAGPASAKRRRAAGAIAAPAEPVKGSGGATNHPRPAKAEAAEAKPKKSKG